MFFLMKKYFFIQQIRTLISYCLKQIYDQNHPIGTAIQWTEREKMGGEIPSIDVYHFYRGGSNSMIFHDLSQDSGKFPDISCLVFGLENYLNFQKFYDTGEPFEWLVHNMYWLRSIKL